MNWRLWWATMLLCPILVGMTITPGHGQAPATTAQATVRRAPSGAVHQLAVPLTPVVREGLRYFRLNAGRCMPDTAVPSATPAGAQTVRIPRPEEQSRRAREATRDMWTSCRRGMRNLGGALSGQLGRLQAFGRWCHNTTETIANVCATVADSCHHLGKVTLPFSGAAPAASIPAPPKPPAVYQYVWVNQRGDRIFTQNPKLNPNPAGSAAWRRAENR